MNRFVLLIAVALALASAARADDAIVGSGVIGGPRYGGGGFLTMADGDARYLKLAADNDPLTGRLDLRGSDGDCAVASSMSLLLNGMTGNNGINVASGAVGVWSLCAGGVNALQVQSTTVSLGASGNQVNLSVGGFGGFGPTISANAGGTTHVLRGTFTTPADSSGTNVHDGLRLLTTIGNATAGTNTARVIDIDPITGDAEVTLAALNIGALTGTAASERAVVIGAGWDTAISSGGPILVEPSALYTTDLVRITAFSGQTGPYFNIRPEDDGANATAFDISPNGTGGSLVFTMRPSTTGALAPLISIGTNSTRFAGLATNGFFFDSLFYVAPGFSGAAATVASQGWQGSASGLDATARSAAGQNFRIASGANAAGEFAVDIGSNDTATAETILRLGTDLDGTPAIVYTMLGTGVAAHTYAPAANLGGTDSAYTLTWTTPADSSGTNQHYGIRVTPTIGNATAGTNTIRAFAVDGVTGDPQVNVIGLDIGAYASPGAEAANAVNIGSNWDFGLDTGSGIRINTATLDITTGTNEDLVERANGTGVVRIQGGTNSGADVVTATFGNGGAASNDLQVVTNSANGSIGLIRSGSGAGGALRISTAGSQFGSAAADAATTITGCIADSLNTAGGTCLFTVYGAGAQAVTPNSSMTISNPTDTTSTPWTAQSETCLITAAGAAAWTPAESTAVNGSHFCCTNVGSNNITMTDSAGVYNGPGSVVGPDDTVCFRYITDHWAEESFSNN